MTKASIGQRRTNLMLHSSGIIGGDGLLSCHQLCKELSPSSTEQVPKSDYSVQGFSIS